MFPFYLFPTEAMVIINLMLAKKYEYFSKLFSNNYNLG